MDESVTKTFDNWLERQQRIQETLGNSIAAHLHVGHQIAASTMELSRRINWMAGPQKRFQEIIEKNISPKLQQWNSDQLLLPLKSAQVALDKAISAHAKILSVISESVAGISIDDFKFEASGAVSLQGESVTVSEIEEATERLAKLLIQLTGLSNSIDLIAKWILDLQKPGRIVFLSVILPFLVSLAANFSTIYLRSVPESIPEKSKAQQLKIIQKIAIQVVHPDVLADRRFVTASVLNVRENGSNRSKIIDKLERGAVVQFVKRRKDWTQIRYLNEDQNEISGWVFTRYLSKFHFRSKRY